MTTRDLGSVIKKHPVSIICLLLSGIMIVLLYLRSDLIPEAERIYAEKTAQGQKLSLNINYSAQLKDQLAAIEAANATIASRMVQASQLGTNTKYFYTLEAATGVKLIDLRQTTPATVAKPAKNSYLPVAFAVAVQGDLHQILDFLQQLENGLHYCRIMNATCSGNSSLRTAPLTLSLSLELLGTP